MALPELDTSQISWIGYWNFLDNGGTSIDPLEAASAMNSYEEYTNGIQGVVTLGYNQVSPNPQIGARVKDDGWIVAWMDRKTNEVNDAPAGTDVRGVHQYIYDWSSGGGNKDIDSNNALAQVIDNLKSSLSNGSAASVNYGDVGVYNYMAEGATTMTLLTYSRGAGDYGSGNMSITPGSGTTLHFGWITASSGGAYGSGAPIYWARDQENIKICDDEESVGTRDVVGRGEITPGETVDVYHTDGNTNSGFTINPIFLWE